MVFTDAEYAYLAGHPLGRLATIGPDGAPQVHPVALWLNEAAGTIDIGGPALVASQKSATSRPTREFPSSWTTRP
jgi:pyridoxamine 5'-phosphate oxidase family protein